MIMRILVVDDEQLIREVIREYIENEGYSCSEADSGVKAIECVEENNYDLIIMDIMMPGMDGYSAVKEIKQIKDIPIIKNTEKYSWLVVSQFAFCKASSNMDSELLPNFQ